MIRNCLIKRIAPTEWIVIDSIPYHSAYDYANLTHEEITLDIENRYHLFQVMSKLQINDPDGEYRLQQRNFTKED